MHHCQHWYSALLLAFIFWFEWHHLWHLSFFTAWMLAPGMEGHTELVSQQFGCASCICTCWLCIIYVCDQPASLHCASQPWCTIRMPMMLMPNDTSNYTFNPLKLQAPLTLLPWDSLTSLTSPAAWDLTTSSWNPAKGYVFCASVQLLWDCVSCQLHKSGLGLSWFSHSHKFSYILFTLILISAWTQVSWTVISHFIRYIAFSTCAGSLLRLVIPLVLSNLHYGNAMFTNPPAHLVWRLLTVTKGVACTIANMHHLVQVSTCFADLCWLKAVEHIDFEHAIITLSLLAWLCCMIPMHTTMWDGGNSFEVTALDWLSTCKVQYLSLSDHNATPLLIIVFATTCNCLPYW